MLSQGFTKELRGIVVQGKGKAKDFSPPVKPFFDVNVTNLRTPPSEARPNEEKSLKKPDPIEKDGRSLVIMFFFPLFSVSFYISFSFHRFQFFVGNLNARNNHVLKV